MASILRRKFHTSLKCSIQFTLEEKLNSFLQHQRSLGEGKLHVQQATAEPEQPKQTLRKQSGNSKKNKRWYRK